MPSTNHAQRPLSTPRGTPNSPLIGVLAHVYWPQNIVNLHPLTNTATTALDQAAFRRVLSLLEREPLVVDFDALG